MPGIPNLMFWNLTAVTLHLGSYYEASGALLFTATWPSALWARPVVVCAAGGIFAMAGVVVLIAIDTSSQAEAAFECKYTWGGGY